MNEPANPHQRAFTKQDFDTAVANQLLRYADFVSRRGYICNTLGNIALRATHPYDPKNGVIYTKHKGISLEEMTAENIVVKDIDGKLLYGSRDTSVGNKLNCEIFKHRSDINAVIHLHVNEILSLFSVNRWKDFPYLSIDAPPVLGKNPHILDPEVNVEQDASHIKDFIGKTNCFIMPNHGVTTLGRDISEAYNRMNTVVAETRRIANAILLNTVAGSSVPYLPLSEVEKLYRIADGLTR